MQVKNAGAVVSVALAAVLLAGAVKGRAGGQQQGQDPGRVLTGEDAFPVKGGGPFDRVYHEENLPQGSAANFGPREWLQSYGNAQHNAAFEPDAGADAWMSEGVSWKFPEARAWPLERDKAFTQDIFTPPARALTTITQYAGNALGVTVADGVVYAESDDFFAYAINAKTGALIWRTSPIPNNLMGNPLVSGDKVILTGGSVAFNFANVANYAENPKSAARGYHVNYNGPFALDKKTGELIWYFPVQGGTMPTPAIGEGRVYFTTGDGYAYAVDVNTGKPIWKTELGGIANMSNPAYHEGMVYVAMSVVPGIYGLDAGTGKVVWKGTIPQATNTGIGDVSPAVADGVVVMDAVNNVQGEGDGKTMDTGVRAFDAKTGDVLWTRQMGRGPVPPAFKGGVPMIHEGVVYIGTPVNNIYQAFDLKTGQVMWTWHIPDPGDAGAGRGPATYYRNVLYVSTGPDVFAVDPRSGELINSTRVGGRFGIVNPVIVGGTAFLGNSWDWVIALPLRDVNANRGKDSQ